MIVSLASAAHHAHTNVAAMLPKGSGNDPLKPQQTEMPAGLSGPFKAALGVGVMVFILFAIVMLLRALFDAVASYKDGAPVPFGSIIQILAFLALGVGGFTGLVWFIVPDGWLVSK